MPSVGGHLHDGGMKTRLLAIAMAVAVVVVAVARQRPGRQSITEEPDDLRPPEIDEKELHAERDYWRDVRRQAWTIALTTLMTLALLGLGPVLTALFSTGPGEAFAWADVEWKKRIEGGTATTAVSGLVATVGALTVALVAGQRVAPDDASIDRIAAATWGRVVTGLSASAAGVATGISVAAFAITDWVEHVVLLVVLSLVAVVLSAVSIQRTWDESAGGAARRAWKRYDDALRRVEAALRPARRHEKAKHVAAVAGSYLAVVFLMVSVLVDWHQVRPTAETVGDLVALTILLAVPAVLVLEPLRLTVRWNARSRALRGGSPDATWLEQQWRWFVAIVPGSALTVLVAWAALSDTDSQLGPIDLVRLFLSLGVVPFVAGVLLARLARGQRGPWAGTLRRLQWQLRLDCRVARDRAVYLERVMPSLLTS